MAKERCAVTNTTSVWNSAGRGLSLGGDRVAGAGANRRAGGGGGHRGERGRPEGVGMGIYGVVTVCAGDRDPDL